jgi:hypothetical protein
MTTHGLSCPSCKSADVLRLSEVLKQQSSTGLTRKTALALRLRGPKKLSISLLIGFILAFGLYFVVMGVAHSSESAAFIVLGPVLFVITWAAITWYLNRDYRANLAAWTEYLNRNFLCRQCSHIFTP